MKCGTIIVGNAILGVTLSGILIPVIMNWGSESAAQRNDGIMACLAASAVLLMLSLVLCCIYHPMQTKRAAIWIGGVVFVALLIGIPWAWYERAQQHRSHGRIQKYREKYERELRDEPRPNSTWSQNGIAPTVKRKVS